MNVVDSLVVTLGLDASGFEKGQKEADTALQKMRDDAAKHGKEIEKSAKDSGESFRTLTREVATFVATLASAKGIYDFLKGLNQVNAAVGRLTQSLNGSPEAISTFGNAVERFGGNATEASGSLQRLLDQFNELRTTGNSAILPWLGQIQSRGGIKIDPTKPLTKQLFALAEDLKSIAAKDPALAMFLGRKLGLDDASIRLLMQGAKGLADALKEARKHAITKEQADASIAVEKAWTGAYQAIRSAGREMLVVLAPGLRLLARLVEWLADGWRHFFRWLVMIKQEWNEWTKSVWEGAKSAMSHVASVISGSGAQILDAFKKAFWGAFDWLKNEFNSIWRKITGGNLFDMSAHAAEAPGGGAGPLAGGAASGASPGGHPGSSGSYGAAAGRMRQMGTPAATGKWWTPERQKYAVDYLMKNAGLSQYGASGLVARWAGVEAASGPGSVNPRSGAFGIAQWLGKRRVGIAGNTDFDAQLAHAARELNTSERKAGDVLRAAKSAVEGARGASMFERAEGYNPATGIDNFTGRTPVVSVYNKAFGARAAASINNSRSSSVVNNSSAQTNIGNVNVQTQATDGPGIVRDLQNAITHHSFAAHLNYGGI
jgi:hypothetical protein